MPVTHPFVSAIPDSADPTLVNPSNWNANHTVSIDLTSEVTGALPLANGGTGGTDLYTINGASIVGTGNLTLATSGAVTGSGLTMATSRLLGRTTAGTGAVEEISVGSGLSLSAGTLSASGGAALTIQNKTGAYTVVAGDAGTIINCTSGTFTVALTAAATLGAGFNCWIWNTSATATDVVTIDPNASETIDGLSTWALRRGEGMRIVSNGTNWDTGDRKALRGFSENIPAALPRPVASATQAVAISNESVASGQAALATQGGTASSNYSTAMGRNSGGGASQAAANGAMALGGSYASGADSFAAAVANNTNTYGAQGANSVAVGQQAKATLASGVAIGTNCVASAASSTAIGSTNTAAGANSCALGSNSSTAIVAKMVYGGPASTSGDKQFGMLLLVKDTTDATPSVLASSSAAAGSNNQALLANNSAHAFDGIVVARQQASGGTASAAWQVSGLIRREANAASTTLVASTVTVISNVPGWTLALTADTTNGGLAITFTGAAATNIRCVATIRTSECIYA